MPWISGRILSQFDRFPLREPYGKPAQISQVIIIIIIVIIIIIMTIIMIILIIIIIIIIMHQFKEKLLSMQVLCKKN